MKLPTKALGSLLLATAVATVPRLRISDKSAERRESRFERMLQRHDRKGDIRAGLLGLDPLVFRNEQKSMPFDELVRAHGFENMQAFRIALIGKLRTELLQRGWSRQRIDNYVEMRRSRMI